MQKLRVNEIFYSLQGEGLRTGIPTWFIRLAGCNRSCAFCDTNHADYVEMTCQEIVKKLEGNCKNIVWTGGEPCLQLTDEVVGFFHDAGYYQALETNGTIRPPLGIDYVAVSPKASNKELERNFLYINELRYVVAEGDPLLVPPQVVYGELLLSPMFDGLQLNANNLEYCIKLCKQHPNWRLSCQCHKLWRIP